MLPSEVARERGVTEILHFTTDQGLLGTLRKGALLSRKQVAEDADVALIQTPVWPVRMPTWVNHISLSISRINRDLHAKAEQRLSSRWWAVLSFAPEVIDGDDVWFATTNNAHHLVCERAQGVNGLLELFRPKVAWGHYGSVSTRWSSTPDHHTTNEQAEALVPGPLSLNHLQRIYVPTPKSRRVVRAWCETLQVPCPEIVISPEMFA